MKKHLIWLLCFVLLLTPFSCVTGEEADSLFSEKDLTVASAADATPLELNGESVEITQEGTYVLSGEIADGHVRVSLAAEGTVYLLLNGVTVRNSSGAALYTENCKKVVLTLAEGTVNTFSQIGAGSTDEDAAIYSRDDLTVNGTGELVVEGGYIDGVNCRDSFKMVSGRLTVTAVDDGLVGKDAVIIGGGTLSVTASEGDGIKATNEDDADRGYVTLAGGDITITTGEGSAFASADSSGAQGWDYALDSQSDAPSNKGVKAVASITLSGANVTVDSVDDALHAGTDISISAGTASLSSGDDGLHADRAVSISGGVLQIPRSYEGIEATDISISGGDITVAASDDGINGAGGDSGEQTDAGWGGGWGRHGRDMFSSSTGTLSISGGRITVSADGDGVDVNGSIAMSGGELYVNGPASSGNGALDYDGSFSMTGGTVVAVGASGMAQGVTDPSGVAGVMLNMQGGGALQVLDSTSTAIITFNAGNSYNSVVIYSALLTDGATYTVKTEGGEQSVTMSAEGSSGGFGGGRGGFTPTDGSTDDRGGFGGGRGRPDQRPGTEGEAEPPTPDNRDTSSGDGAPGQAI